MEYLFILGRAAESAAETTAQTQVVPINQIWEQIIALSWLQAVLAVSFGVVYLLYGWRIFKILVIICFALVGLFIGVNLGSRIGSELNTQIWGGLIGSILLAAISIPLMRWMVSVLGAVAGGILASGVWYAFEFPGKYILAGALVGIVAGGMISFIVFKIAVMLFTSLGGGALVMVGMLALANQWESVQHPATEHIKEMFFNHNWFLPVLLMIPTAIGIIVQNSLIKKSQNWVI